MRFVSLQVQTTFFTEVAGLGEQIRLCLRVEEPNRYFFPKYKNWLIAQKQLTLPENERRFIHPKDQWDGWYKFHFGNRFPTGLLHIVTDFLDRSEISYVIKQAYTSPSPSDDISLINFVPREYQLETIKKALELKRAVIQLPTNAGKCVSGDSWVYTENGLCQINDITKQKIPSKILTTAGMLEPVAMFKIGDKEQAISIRLENGLYLTGSPDHRVLTYADGLPVYVKLRDLEVGSFAAVMSNHEISPSDNSIVKFDDSNESKHRSPITIPDKMTPEFARFLGYLIGDGTMTPKSIEAGRLGMSVANPIILEDLQRVTKTVFGVEWKLPPSATIDWSLSSLSIIDVLRLNGVHFAGAKEKEIPSVILKSSREIICNFIRAYYDCDGEVSKLVLTTSSKKMSEQLQIILIGLGFHCTVRSRKSVCNGKYTGIHYRVSISHLDYSLFETLIGPLKLKTRAVKVQKTRAHGIPIQCLPMFELVEAFKKIGRWDERIHSNVPNNSKWSSTSCAGKRIELLRRDIRKCASKKQILLLDLKLACEYFRKYGITLPTIEKLCHIPFPYQFYRVTKIEDTISNLYDFQMPSPNNYVSSQFISHNTEVILAIIKAFQPNQFIYFVHLKNLLYQTKDRIKERLGFEPGIVGDGVVDLRPEGNIVMLQSANDDLLDKLRNCPIMVIDEVHHSTMKEWYKSAMKIQSPVRYGLSATPVSKEVYSDWKLMALCGPIIGNITNKELIEKGFSTRPFIEIHKVKLPKFVPRLINDEDEETTKMAQYQQLLEFLFSSSIRNAQISRIVRKYSDKSTMVMVSRKAHGCELRKLIPGAEFVCGEDSTEIRNDALKRFKAGELKVLISTLFGEGTDIPNIEVLVFSYPISFDRPLLQRIGRGLRKGEGKNEVRIIDFDDTCSHHLQKALEQRKEVYNGEGFIFEYYEEQETKNPFV